MAEVENNAAQPAAEANNNLLTLEFADGTVMDFEVIGAFPFEGKEYVALAPVAEAGEFYIYEQRKVGEGQAQLMDIEEEEEYERVMEEFDRLTGTVTF